LYSIINYYNVNSNTSTFVEIEFSHNVKFSFTKQISGWETRREVRKIKGKGR